MKFNKIKRILAQTLIFTIMMSNIMVKADLNENVSSTSEEVSTTIIESEVNDNLGEDNSKNDIIQDVEENVEEESPSEESVIENEIEDVKEVQDELQELQDEAQPTEEVKPQADDQNVDDLSQEEGKVGEVYSTKKVDIANSARVAEDPSIYESIEYKLKMESIATMEFLETKTDNPYEIAMAHENGTFTFVKGVESLEEAIEEIGTISMQASSEGIQPAVISRSGQVVYTTNAMARILKHVGGKPYGGADRNTYLYSDPALTKSNTYVNHAYVDDAPILEDAGNSAKILVTGYEAWINKNTNAPEYDMIVVPLNQVKNPSYYYVENGDLKHYITSDLKGSSGHSITVTKAPSYLKQGVKYLSYDGVYFYDGSYLQSGLDVLISDYKRGTRGNAINAGQPFYSYFNYLPFRSKTSYTADELNKFIVNNTESSSKLRGIGADLKDAEQRYGVNAILTLGVAINESGWGMSSIAQSKNNLFGINAVDSNPGQAANSFNKPGDSVLEFAKNYISRGYSDPADWRYNGGYLGNKKNGANVKYASDPFWGEKAAQYAYRIDKYLSGSINNLKDYNTYQIAMATTNNKVIKSNGTLLYNITNDKNQYSGYIETPFIITNNSKKNIGGKNYYEIYPERNTPVNNGGTANKYSGDYDWFDRGYVLDSGIKFLNQSKNVTITQPWVTVQAGRTRYETAVQISKSRFNTSNTVVIANGYSSADGLASAPLAALNTAPLLLVEKDSLTSYTKDEISRLKATNVIIVGGELVISQKVEAELRNIGIKSITRLAGRTRYDTSLEVAKYFNSKHDISEVVIANGMKDADAMSIAPVAARDKMPIILCETDSVPRTTMEWLKSQGLSNAYVLGGTLAISDNVMNSINGITSENISGNRLGGRDRYETNALVIDRFYPETLDTVIVTKGSVLVDALAAGPLAGLNNYPIVLAGNDLVGEQKHVLGKRTARRIYQAGYGVSGAAVTTLKRCLEYLNY